MFRLASFDLAGRRILVVEEEDSVAQKMAEEIVQAGGISLGPVTSVTAALDLIPTMSRVDCAMLDVRHIAETELPIITVFRQLAVEVVFVTGFDDWYTSYEN